MRLIIVIKVRYVCTSKIEISKTIYRYPICTRIIVIVGCSCSTCISHTYDRKRKQSTAGVLRSDLNGPDRGIRLLYTTTDSCSVVYINNITYPCARTCRKHNASSSDPFNKWSLHRWLVGIRTLFCRVHVAAAQMFAGSLRNNIFPGLNRFSSRFLGHVGYVTFEIRRIIHVHQKSNLHHRSWYIQCTYNYCTSCENNLQQTLKVSSEESPTNLLEIQEIIIRINHIITNSWMFLTSCIIYTAVGRRLTNLFQLGRMYLRK